MSKNGLPSCPQSYPSLILHLPHLISIMFSPLLYCVSHSFYSTFSRWSSCTITWMGGFWVVLTSSAHLLQRTCWVFLFSFVSWGESFSWGQLLCFQHGCHRLGIWMFGKVRKGRRKNERWIWHQIRKYLNNK